MPPKPEHTSDKFVKWSCKAHIENVFQFWSAKLLNLTNLATLQKIANFIAFFSKDTVEFYNCTNTDFKCSRHTDRWMDKQTNKRI